MDLAARRRALVEQDGSRAGLGGPAGGRDSGGTGADDGDVAVEGFDSRVESRRLETLPPAFATVIPSRTVSRHARRWARPSIVTRHS